MNTDQLAEVLERGAAPVPRPDLAAPAWERAAVVRRKRVATTATIAAVVMVGAVTFGVVWGTRETAAPPVSPPSSPATSTAPASELQSMAPLTIDMVREPFNVQVDYPDEQRFALPTSFQPTGVDPDGGGPAVAALQLDDGSVYFLDTARTWRAPARTPSGRLFSESLALDGGAVALRGETSLEVYSLFADKAFSYDASQVATTGLWANDSVGLFYDVPGPGGEVREHEGSQDIHPVAFPLGQGLADTAMDPLGHSLSEFVDDRYVLWSNFQDVGILRDTQALGDLRRPVAHDGAVAVVRSGLNDTSPAAADGVVVIGANLRPAALLPVEGVDMNQVVLHDFVDSHTLLIEVADRLVTWNYRSGDLKDVATLPPGSVVSFAYDNLQSWPRAPR